MIKLRFKKIKQTILVLSILCLPTSAFALHDKSSACGKGHEGWKQDCSKGKGNGNGKTDNVYIEGAPSPQMGATINGLLLAMLVISLYYKKIHLQTKKENAD